MTESRNDVERLSALLEGRVTGPEREALLAHISASEDDYELFTGTARVLRALEEEDARAAAAAPPADEDVIPLPPAGSGTRPFVRWLALAAVVAGVVLISTWALRGRTPAGADPVRLAAVADPARRGLPEDWVNQRPWADRGDGPSGDDQARAAQAGVMILDLAVAVRTRDSVTTRILARQASRRFEEGVGGATPLLEIARRAGEPPEVLEELLDRAADRLADNLDSGFLQIGAWTEAARLAAAKRQEPFFRDRANREMLRLAERLTRSDDAAHDAVAQVRAAIPAQGEPAWPALEGALEELLGEITD